MIVTVEVLRPMIMRMLISYCHDLILSAGCLVHDRDSGGVIANDYGTVYQLLSRRDSFAGLFD